MKFHFHYNAFFIRYNLSSKLIELLSELNHQATYVYDIGLSRATGLEIFQYAKDNGMIIISADTDFGYILSEWNSSQPSVILFRYLSLNPTILIEYLKRIIKDFEEELIKGSIIVVQPDKVRIRRLPFYQ